MTTNGYPMTNGHHHEIQRLESHSALVTQQNRVFVNRSLQLSKIKFYGFDMDYTLAGYKSPATEILAFELVVERLISIGYPVDLRKFEYVPHFPVRGLWFDMEYGNLLKVDAYGNILVGVHGFHYMNPVFVNRSLQLSKIKFYGFDMDYTLAGYKSPATEILAFELVVERLISIGYPVDLRKFEYVPHFPVRGLWFDMEYGNLLKVDAYGNILVGVHGFHYMNPHEIEQIYPNKFLHLNDNRIYVLNTLFNLPETYMLACLIDYFDSHAEYTKNSERSGVTCGDVTISYRSIFRDVRSAVDWVHIDGPMKAMTVADMDKYVIKDDRMGPMLKRMRANAKTFLLTNSGYAYTRDIMTYLLGEDWITYFDYVIVDARKPLWFAEGTVFREVNMETGELKLGMHTGTLRSGCVYSGGSCSVFTKMVKTRGKDVLYIGDHIFGDVLRSKKSRGWRTFLVVPELEQELKVWEEDMPTFERLQKLDTVLGEMYKDMDSSSTDKPNIKRVTQAMRELTHQMDQSYGMLGSLFRSGTRSTFFASQAERYADLYSSNCNNLLYYPFTYFFRNPPTLFPHETAVNALTVQQSVENLAETSALVEEFSSKDDAFEIEESKDGQKSPRKRTESEQSLQKDRKSRARTPRHSTFVHEDDPDDERETSNSGEDTPETRYSKARDSHSPPVEIDCHRSEVDLKQLLSNSGHEDVVVIQQATCDPEN